MSIELFSMQLCMRLSQALGETLLMSVGSALIAILIGLPLGLVLASPQPPYWTKILQGILNMMRAIPFIILVIIALPLTRWITGSSLGWPAAMVPLSLAAIPFYARLAEQAFTALPPGLWEAGLSMGGSRWMIYRYLWLPEAWPSLIRASTTLLISLIGFSAMAGVVGGGGLGALAYHSGFQRFDSTILWSTVILLVLLVEMVQRIGHYMVCVALSEANDPAK